MHDADDDRDMQLQVEIMSDGGDTITLSNPILGYWPYLLIQLKQADDAYVFDLKIGGGNLAKEEVIEFLSGVADMVREVPDEYWQEKLGQ